MSANIISGKDLAAQIRQELKEQIEQLGKKNIVPGLSVILAGVDPASVSYVTAKERACEEIGIFSDDNRLSADISEKELLGLIDQKNKDPKINGILVQLPLPKHIDEAKVLMAIDPAKDVDGFHPVNVGKMVVGERAFLPCTPHGVLQMLKRSGIKTEGAEIVIVGRSNIVGKPLANMLIQKSELGNATVTVCHTRTKDIAAHTLKADIVIAATGYPNTITADMIKPGAAVIDVGVNRIEDATKQRGYRLVGDVDFEGIKEKAGFITPVPGGVGPMTITMLLYNTVQSAKMAAGLPVD